MEKKNNSMNSIKKILPIHFIFFLIINITLISSQNNRYVYFPLKKKDNTKLNNIKNITEIMQFIFLEPLISELTLGDPGQKSDIIFRTDCTYMYITSYRHTTKKQTQASDFMQLKYGNFIYYNTEKSTSVNFYEQNFNFTSYARDNQFFSNCISEKMKINDNNIKFDLMLSNSIELEEPGAFCLQLEEGSSVLHFTSSFPVLLKKNYSIIDNYQMFIYYGKNNNEKDYLVLGTTANLFTNPETGEKIYPDIDMENDYFTISDGLDVWKAAMEIKFDDIYLNSSSNQIVKFEDTQNLKGKLVPNIGFIVGTTNYSQYLEKNIFDKYIQSGQCHHDRFYQRVNLAGDDYFYYYCEESLYDNIRSVFNNIIFKQSSLQEKFILTFEDLFIKQNGYLIFLVLFSTHLHPRWELGTPFLRKYQFDFDFNNKIIGYYHIKIKEEEEQKTSIWVYIIVNFFLALILFGILIVFWFYLKKYFFANRKKRANELDDDDYEYQQKKDDNGNDNLIINEENK